MAWFFGRYVESVAAAGRAEYALPLYVNAALIRPAYRPGQYPSAGPLPHLIDLWRAAAPTSRLARSDVQCDVSGGARFSPYLEPPSFPVQRHSEPACSWILITAESVASHARPASSWLDATARPAYVGAMDVERPTVRSIARTLDLSRSTVSNALRGLPTVNPETRRRVQEAATALGYAALPFASEIMSQLRRNDRGKQIGTLAVLEMSEPARSPVAELFNGRLLKGIEKRAAEIGFSVSSWRFGGASVSLSRLDQILQWRGIHGLLLLPCWSEPDFTCLDWTKFTAVYVDYLIRRPALHTVCSDHFRRIFDAMEKARSLGYRRAGLVVEKRANERLNGRWVSAYLGFQHEYPEMLHVPPLVVDEFTPKTFLPWFRAHKPDVVITHWLDAPRYMGEAGAEVPRTHGYICLSLLGAPEEFSGFDQQPQVIGARAAELVISQLGHQERGAPLVPTHTLLPATWVPGATVRTTN